MQINITSLKKIIGNSKELIFYGFGECHYLDVYNTIYKEREFNSYCFSGGKFPKIAFDEGNDVIKNKCKALITSTLIENYKRTRQGLPIIPLVFCVGYEGDDSHFTLDLDKVAQRGKVSTTLPELRRCFKSCFEMGPEIKIISDQTFKFVQVKQDQFNKDLYYLNPVAPFWKQSPWLNLWAQRKMTNHHAATEKKHPWRDILIWEFKRITAEYDDREPKIKCRKR